jgi:hypothetical protein
MTQFAEFGPLIVETDVDVAVVTTLRTWLPTYLSRAEDERGLDNGLLARPVPSSYTNTLDDEDFPDQRLPAIVVTTASTSNEPRVGRDDYYSAAWRVLVTAVVRGRTPPETRAVAALFGGCVRRILVQNTSLDGFAGGVKWLRGNVAPVEDMTDKGRYLAAGINEFTVYVDEVLRQGVGPAHPDSSPYPPGNPGTPNEPYDPLVTVTEPVSVDVTHRTSD